MVYTSLFLLSFYWFCARRDGGPFQSSMQRAPSKNLCFHFTYLYFAWLLLRHSRATTTSDASGEAASGGSLTPTFALVLPHTSAHHACHTTPAHRLTQTTARWRPAAAATHGACGAFGLRIAHSLVHAEHLCRSLGRRGIRVDLRGSRLPHELAKQQVHTRMQSAPCDNESEKWSTTSRNIQRQGCGLLRNLISSEVFSRIQTDW